MSATEPESIINQQRRPRQPSPQQTPKPKKRKSTHVSNEVEPDWYNIKGIIDEKVHKGKLYYLIDWDGADKNGEPHKPTWEPQDHVSVPAINAWRDEKHLNEDPREAEPESFVGLVGESSDSLSPRTARKFVKDRDSRIVVELPWKSARDLSEYLALSSTHGSQQSSQLTPAAPARATELQQDQRIIPDSQEISATSVSESQNSQLDLRGLLATGRSQGEGIAGHRSPGDRVPTTSEYSTTEIPSRQPDFPALSSFDNFANASFFIRTGPSSPNQPASFHSARHFTAKSSELATSGGGLPSFSTQTNNNINIDPPTSQLLPIAHNSTEIPLQEQSSGVHNSRASLSQDLSSANTRSPQTTSQAAQVVVPLSSAYHESFTQSQVGSGVHDEESIVPETVSRSQRTHQASQASTRALSELDANSIITSSVSNDEEPGSQAVPIRVDLAQAQVDRSSRNLEEVDSSIQESASARPHNSPDHSVRHTKPQPLEKLPVTPTKMDDAQSNSKPMSTAEKLRMIRDRNLAKLNVNPPPIDPPAPTAPSETKDTNQTGANADAPVIPSTESSADAAAVPSTDAQPAQVPEAPSLTASPTLLIPSFETDRSEQPSIRQSSEFERHQASVESVQSKPATLNPSALTLSIEQDTDISPSVPTDDAFGVGLPVPDELESRQNDEAPQDYPKGLLPHVPTGPNEYLVTVPLQNSVRPQYNDILRENEALMDEYNASFRISPHQTPDPTTVSRIDEMFSRLYDICDLPPFLDTVSSLGPAEITKHVIGTNAKFAFMDELLTQLREMECDKKILILARPLLIDLLGHVIKTRGYRYIQSGVEIIGASAAHHPLTVAVSSTEDEPHQALEDFDAVIVFDHTFRQSLLPSLDSANLPVVMTLASTASIQHLNMRIVENMDPLERRNVLILTLIKAMRYVEDPDFPVKPPDIAELFSKHIQMPDDDEFYWEPQPIPEYVFEGLHAASSQEYLSQVSMHGYSADQVPSSRKRSHVDDDDEASSKRPKISQPQVVPEMDRVDDALTGLTSDGSKDDPSKTTATISAEKLEALSAKMAKLEAELGESKVRENQFRELSDRSKKELDGYVSTVTLLHNQYMGALKDRGTFESDCANAKDEAKLLNANLESSRSENGKLKEKNEELQLKLSEATELLRNSSNPDLVKVGRLEKDLEEHKSKVQSLEKRVALAQSDMNYAKDAYQNASQRATELQAENRVLERRVEELSRKADENIVEINRIQSENEVTELVRMLNEQKTIVREREVELGRVKDELRTLKNGRRETRQNSVPRSPRLSALGVMSPRNGARGHSNIGGASSRGNSPAPPLGVFESPGGVLPNMSSFNQQSGNNRYSHLRDSRF
ncbi:hypothetical protein F4779DRAFT_626738 [Xylariaceae sp. FL0662B]|nr:hypothetical protein F4779DRAFT_626738 [Xylariaceae sp. FL0662B]